jgi:hypothetical protein
VNIGQLFNDRSSDSEWFIFTNKSKNEKKMIFILKISPN